MERNLVSAGAGCGMRDDCESVLQALATTCTISREDCEAETGEFRSEAGCRVIILQILIAGNV